MAVIDLTMELTWFDGVGARPDGIGAKDNKNNMKKKVKPKTDPDMLDEYDFSKGVRGKYAARYAEGTNVVLLAPDVAAVFPNAEAVNEALRALIKIAQKANHKTKA